MRLAVMVLTFAALGMPLAPAAQTYDDPAIVVCELLVRANFEIEPIKIKKTSATVEGSTATINFERQILNSKPSSQTISCPFTKTDGHFVLNVGDNPGALAPIERALGISGFYPIPEAETALR